jgi:hypothetical protein
MPQFEVTGEQVIHAAAIITKMTFPFNRIEIPGIELFRPFLWTNVSARYLIPSAIRLDRQAKNSNCMPTVGRYRGNL